MNTHTNKIQEKKNQSVANRISNVHSGVEYAFQFVDNRPEVIAQRKLKEMSNNSPRAQQAAQLKSLSANYTNQIAPRIHKEINKSIVQRKEANEHFIQIVTQDDLVTQKSPSSGTNQETLQLQTIKIGVKSNKITTVKISDGRPGTNLPGGHQGEHTTAFVTFKHMAINNVKGKTLEQAKENLVLTLESMKEFPGYADAPKYLTEGMQNTLNVASTMNPPTKIDIENLMKWAIEIRNSIPLTANKKKTTGGHGEGMHGGGMQMIEQNVRTGKIKNKEDVGGNLMINVWGLFDFNALTPDSAGKWAKLLVQHMLSMVASYPHIFEIKEIYSLNDIKTHLYKHHIPKGKFGDDIKAEIEELI